VRRDGVRRPRVGFADRHPGGAGAPPVPTTRPCQELADDRQVFDPRVYDPRVQTQAPNVTLTYVRCRGSGALRRKRGPALTNRPHVARREAPAVSGDGHGHQKVCAFRRATPFGKQARWEGNRKARTLGRVAVRHTHASEHPLRHPGESRGPGPLIGAARRWIPACAGMTSAEMRVEALATMRVAPSRGMPGR